MRRAMAFILSLAIMITMIPVSYSESVTATLMTELPKDGDRVVIHNTKYNKALGPCGTAASYYNKGVDMTPQDGVLSGVTDDVVWDVTVTEDGNYRFSQNGRYLSMGASFSSTPYDDVNKDWKVAAYGNGYSIMNVKRKNYLEWYSSKNYFSGYGTISDNGMFEFRFYQVTGEIVKEPKATPDGAGITLPGTEVTLSCETEGASVYYSFDGTDFTLYTAPVAINESCTLYAYAMHNGAVSATVSFTYTVSSSDIMSIPVALAAGDVASAKVVGQLVYRFGNYGSVNSAILQTKIGDEIYGLQCYHSLDVYDDGSAVGIGDWVVLTGKLGAYGGVQQIQSLTGIRRAEEDEIIGTDASEAQVYEDITSLLADADHLLSEYVLLKNVTLGEYQSKETTNKEDVTVSDAAGKTITIYRAAPYPAGVEKDDVVHLYCVVSAHNGKSQLRNGSSKDYIPTQDKLGPVITRVTNADAEVGKAYVFTVKVEDASGVSNVMMEVFDGGGSLVCSFENVEENDGEYTVVIPAEYVTAGNLSVEVTATDGWTAPNSSTEEFEIVVIDLPQIRAYSPEANSATGDDKRPTVSVTLANCGENPVVEMTLNGVSVTPVLSGSVASYTPTEDLEDGKVVVYVKITRADGKTYETSWSFIVGEATYLLYFGELHSHTAEYSDGAGTLEQALEHARQAAQIDFLAVTDHSNFYDTKDNPNGDMTDASKGLMTADGSKTRWQEAKDTAALYADDSFIPIIGYEMTWSGQYGHINTFNSIGFESRNVPKYVVKGGPGLVAYYDRLVEVARIDKENGRKTTINQFNHPGLTFGTFEDFAHYTPAYDELITMIEVGNGEGKVGGSMYWPSYQYYTMALDKGWHLAPTNNQDNHKGGWGDSNTCRDVIYTDNFSEEGIYDAMRSMTMYATEDNDLEIYYTLNGKVMGTIMDLEDGAKLTIRVDFRDPTDKVQKVSVIANGDVTVASKTFNAQSGSWEIEIDNNYSYYYIRVDEVDSDIAVTAPVWTSDTVKVGMSPVEKDTVIEMKGEPITFSVPLYNYEEAKVGEDASAADLVIVKAVYSIGGEVKETVENPQFADGTSVLNPSRQDGKLTWVYTPDETGRFTMEVKVTAQFRGVEYVFNGSLGFTVRDGEDMALMLIDAGHSNFYVSGGYADSDTAFIELAAQYGVKSQHITAPITDEVLENCDLLVLTVPFRGASVDVSDSLYSEEEIEAIRDYAARGGNFIVCSKSDRLEPEAQEQWASTISNEILEAIGAKARVGKGIVSDAVNNTNESYRLHFIGKDFYNWNTPLTEYLIENTNLMFSCYNAAPILLNGAESVVNAFDTSFVSSYPMYYTGGNVITADKRYQPYYDACGDQDVVSVLAYEELSSGGFCITSGVTFFSTFEVKVEMESAATLQNTNYQIVVDLFKMLHPAEITPIAEIHAAGKTNVAYTIEGYVTANASGYDRDTAFFDCIYLQDESGRGINVFPVAGRYEIGQKLRITGMTSEYMGEIELNCGNDYGGEIQDITLRDREYTADGVTTKGYATRARLLNVEIVVGDNKQSVATYVIDDSALNEVIDEICAENADACVETLLTTAEAAAADKVGNLIEFTGVVTKVEFDANGVLGAIHVDDGTGEVLLFLDGYINCDDDCEKDEQGYHDLGWVKEGVLLRARGIASIGQNSYEHSDRIGPRIRIRNRADIKQVTPLYGDANCDGQITSKDAELIILALIGQETLTVKGKCNADVAPDYSGTPNAADAAAILRYVLGEITAFEVETAE